MIALPPPPAPIVCQEDAPCFNWRTMGNHKRGIITTGGRYLVVGPKRFERIRWGAHIDWKRTPILNGDTP